VNYVFTAIFALEAVIKIIALDKIYFKDGWNIFDFFIVLLTIGSVFVSINTSLNVGGATTIVRTFRVTRIFRLIKRAKSLKLVFNTFIMTLPALGNVGSLLLLLLYLYAVLGV
jgi:voltage-dependent calcium channel L type alpha-1D